MSKNTFIQAGSKVIETELQAISDLKDRVNNDFAKACEQMLACEGRIVVTGMGKSGHIGHKIAATLASTGTPAFFVHPAEASHGDLGMITSKDVVLALSYSGETAELLTIIPIIKRLGVPLIAMSGRTESSLAREASIHLNVNVKQEACPHNLAPTSSTTATLVMGDALAIALLEGRGFTPDDFARSHPGGALGRRLLVHVSDIMHTGDELPSIPADASLLDALQEMSSKRLGMTAIIDSDKKVLGIYTDGDIRRTLEQSLNPKTTPIKEVMTPHCKTIQANILAAEALKIMEDNKINGFLVVDENNKLIGALNMHDLLRAGVV